jgi:ribulose-bisphosphate carboxylase large chain
MGLSPGELADLAYQFALGGIDMIKDDHGLSDQSFCRFDERVERCSEAVARASEKNGKKCLYFPNITGPIEQVLARAKKAKSAGAGGVVISPGIVGLDTMRMVAEDDSIALPVLFHPALTGSFTVNARSGISHGTLYGQISRLAGADAAIFPSYGGRFSFSEEECRELVGGTELAMGRIKTSFPVPAGGMSTSRIPELLDFYGKDVILLIGGDLHRHGPDLTQNCREFVKLVTG